METTPWRKPSHIHFRFSTDREPVGSQDFTLSGEGGATFQKYLIDRYPYPLIVFQKKLTREEVVAILNQEFGGKEM